MEVFKKGVKGITFAKVSKNGMKSVIKIQKVVLSIMVFSQNFFNLSRSCRQGDPPSPYLFILSIEPLAMEMLGNHNIKVITVNNDIVKLGQYADDTFLLLDGSEQSIVLSIETFTNFQICSGLKMNIEKPVAIQ